jgi:uncharacterized protein (TIGR00297 family)
MIVALAIAGVVALLAFLLRALSAGGAVAATFVGAAAVLGGPGWVVLLMSFFVSTSILSRWRAADRERITGALIEKGARRDAIQVLANGAVFAAASFLSTFGSTFGNAAAWQAIGAGSIAAATADTWSTEIGTVLGRSPRLVTNGRLVQPGTSGAVTTAGIASAAVASLFMALVASRMDWTTPVYAVAAGGMTGSLVDSLLGATIQERRWCTSCLADTERRIHSCGTRTSHRGGISGCDNDVVNLMSIIAGAVVTWTLT